MKKLYQRAVSRLQHLSLAASVVALTAAPASAQNLNKAKGVLEVFQSEFTTIVPIVAAIGLLAFGLAYAQKWIEKDTFIRWAIGLIIGGSAVPLVGLFFT